MSTSLQVRPGLPFWFWYDLSHMCFLDTETPLGDLRGPQLTFRLNRLRGFSQAANLSAVQLSDIINVRTSNTFGYRDPFN
jgi:hypothetical protein